MTDAFDDDTQFWDEPEWVRTGPTQRVRTSRDRSGSFERTRSHRVVRHDDPPPTQALTFDDFAPADDDAWSGVEHWVEPEHHRAPFVGVDPRLVRIGGVALVGVLMIPLALALRDDPDEEVRSAPPAEAATTVTPVAIADPATTVLTVPITAAATAPATAATTPARAAQALAAAPAAEEPEPCAGTYVVIGNDSWNRFPKSSGASVQEWLAANDATADTPLYVGDELCIPAGAQAPAPPTTAAPTTAAPTTTAAPATTRPPATTAPPVATSPPATAAPPPVAAPSPPAAPADPASVEAMIRAVWPDELEERALTIARRESGLRPEAHNYCCYGIFAIYFEMGRSWLGDLGITSAQQLLDARTNIEAAYHLYTLSGWQPWRQTDPG